MVSKVKRGPGYAMKPTRFFTNSIATTKALRRRYPGIRGQVHLIEGKARAAATYPQRLRRTMCRVTLDQAKMDVGDMVCKQCSDSDGDQEDPNLRGGI